MPDRRAVPLLAMIGAVLGLLSSEPLLAIAGFVSLLVGLKALWRPGEIPILLGMFGYQWVQVNIKTLSALQQNIPVEALNLYGGNISLAIVLGNGALIALALGMRWGAGRREAGSGQLAQAQAAAYPLNFWVKVYALGWAVSALATYAISLVPGLAQPLIALSSIRWVGFLLLTYAAFRRSPRWHWWWLIFAMEFFLAIGGYFSGFQLVIFYAMFGIAAAVVQIKLRHAAPLLMLVLLLGVSALIWTYVKDEFRTYVSGGERAQIVTVDRPERLAELTRLASDFRPTELSQTYKSLVDRLAYVDFFGRVLTRVPEIVPYEEGALWGDALVRAVTPRALFPDKVAVHDSVRTIYYSGVDVATHEQGTSISIGYVAESYIDFGAPLMFVAVLGLGLLMGRFYRSLLHSERSPGIWGMALATVALWPAALFETSITKMVPTLAVSMLTAWALSQLVLPVLVRRIAGEGDAVPGRAPAPQHTATRR